jgi:hypothetical protein
MTGHIIECEKLNGHEFKSGNDNTPLMIAFSQTSSTVSFPYDDLEICVRQMMTDHTLIRRNLISFV